MTYVLPKAKGKVLQASSKMVNTASAAGPYTVSITSQGQISIPAPIRRKLGLNQKKKAIVSERDGKVVIEPVKDLLELKGSLKTKIKATPKQIRQAFEQYLAERAAKKLK